LTAGSLTVGETTTGDARLGGDLGAAPSASLPSLDFDHPGGTGGTVNFKHPDPRLGAASLAPPTLAELADTVLYSRFYIRCQRLIFSLVWPRRAFMISARRSVRNRTVLPVNCQL
jgi:hypothetical protein